MAASLYSAIRTRVVTEATSSHAPPTSTRARPVITSCTRPRSARSMRPASLASVGLPSAWSSRKTSVSAPRTTVRPAVSPAASADTRWATARAFARASSMTASAGGPERQWLGDLAGADGERNAQAREQLLPAG